MLLTGRQCDVWGLPNPPPVTPHLISRWDLSWLEMTHICTQCIRGGASFTEWVLRTGAGFLSFVTLMSYSPFTLSPCFVLTLPIFPLFFDSQTLTTAPPSSPSLVTASVSLRVSVGNSASPVTLLVGW